MWPSQIRERSLGFSGREGSDLHCWGWLLGRRDRPCPEAEDCFFWQWLAKMTGIFRNALFPVPLLLHPEMLKLWRQIWGLSKALLEWGTVENSVGCSAALSPSFVPLLPLPSPQSQGLPILVSLISVSGHGFLPVLLLPRCFMMKSWAEEHILSKRHSRWGCKSNVLRNGRPPDFLHTKTYTENILGRMLN